MKLTGSEFRKIRGCKENAHNFDCFTLLFEEISSNCHYLNYKIDYEKSFF